jgi:hypothetical protein
MTQTLGNSDAGREMEHMSNLEFLWRQSFLGKSLYYVPNLRALVAEKGGIFMLSLAIFWQPIFGNMTKCTELCTA